MTTTPDDIAKAVNDLVTMPDICARLLALINDENSNLDDIARLIGADVGLAARVLRLANSPFYGHGGKVDSLNQAMMVTGMHTIVSLVLATCSVQTLNSLPRGMDDLEHFWEHSVYVSALAHALAQIHGRCSADQAMLAGLLHDVGLLAMAVAAPELSTVLEVKRSSWHGPSHELERSFLGFDHGQVGAALLRRWSFPESLVVAVEHHHQPQAAEGFVHLQHTVHVADAIAHALGVARENNKPEPHPWPDDLLEALGLEAERVNEAQALADAYMNHLMQLIMPPARAA